MRCLSAVVSVAEIAGRDRRKLISFSSWAHIHPLRARSCASFRRSHCRGRVMATTASPESIISQSPFGTHAPLHVRETVVLEENEEEIFKTLVAAVEHHGLKTTLRCAGGWVRDKLLGITSPDIDVALDDMLGREFAEKVNEYLVHIGEETHGVGVIQSNPDQSKHLETARMRVRGVWIDLVNLRSETYAEGSRIPEMTFGTPEQDALRRDLTINALFYNLHTRSVEDLTARGIPDLRAGLCRTPLPPRDTFLDDPLRALRAVRFASRLGFTVDPALASAAGSPEVLQALASKVSRERIGTEVSGMLEGPHPARAVRLLSSMGLLPVALRAPDGVPPSEAWAAAGASCAEGLLAVLAALAGPNDGAREGGEEGSWVRRLPGEQRRVAVLAATLLPLRTIEASAGKKKKIFAASAVVRESLKLRGKDADDVGALHAALPRVAQCARALVLRGADSGAPESVQEELGVAIRALGEGWRVAACLAPLLAMKDALVAGKDGAVEDEAVSAARAAVGGGSGAWEGSEGSSREEAVKRMAGVAGTVIAAAEGMGIATCYEWKPLLTGKDLMASLGVKGPALGTAVDMVMRWQLRNPQGTREEAEEYIKGAWGSGK